MKVTLFFTTLLIASSSVIGAPSGEYDHSYGSTPALANYGPSDVSVKSVDYSAKPVPVTPVQQPNGTYQVHARKPDTDYQKPIAVGYQSPTPIPTNSNANVENVAVKAVDNGYTPQSATTTTTTTTTTTPCATDSVQDAVTTPCEGTATAAPTQYQDVSTKTVDAYEAMSTSIPDITSRYASANQNAKGSLYGQSSDASKVGASACALLLVSGISLLAL